MSRLRFKFFSVIADAIFVNLAVLAALTLRFLGAIPAENFDAYLRLAPFLTLSYLICGWLYNLYEPEQHDSPWATTARVFPAVILGTLGLTAAAFLGGTETVAFPRLALPMILILSGVFLLGWRILFLRAANIRWPEQRTLIIGCSEKSGNVADDLAEAINLREKWGWKLVAVVPSGKGLDAINDMIYEHRINRVIVANPALLREFIEQLVLTEHTRLTVDVVPELYEAFIGRTHSIVGDIPLVRIISGTTPRYHLLIKRLFDFCAALVLIIASLPVTILAALAIALFDKGPIFYRQVRVGQNQKPFTIYKFRTMAQNAEELSGPVLAAEDDPRITAVGKILRIYRIDELPQMINIVRGEMSFVGPRPERPSFVEEYAAQIPGYSERFRIKPGVTGLAQINGGYATTPELKLKYDLMYLYHQGFGFDVQIAVETIKVVLSGKGAR